MLFGYNTNGFAQHDLKDALVILDELGYRSVGLTLDHGFLNPYSRGQRLATILIQGLLAQTPFKSVIETGARFLLDPRHKHQPTLISPQASGREKRLDFLCKAVDVATALGSD